MIDLKSISVFLFDLDDTLIDTHTAKMIGLQRAYQKLVSECITGFDKLPSYEEFEKDLTVNYKRQKPDGTKFFDYDPDVFDGYCNSMTRKEGLRLKHYGFSLAARLCLHYRDAKNNSLMALPCTFELLNYLKENSTVYCITEGSCNYQHTKAMLTDIENEVESVFVTTDKIKALKEFVDEKGFNKKETVMVGDSENDIKAGRNAGVGTICIKSKRRGNDYYGSIQADLMLKGLDELLGMLKAKR